MIVTLYLADCTVEVEGDYIPAEYGERDAEGQQLEQDWPAEFLVSGFTMKYPVQSGINFELTDDMLPIGLIHSKFYDDLEAAVLDKLAKEQHA